MLKKTLPTWWSALSFKHLLQVDTVRDQIVSDLTFFIWALRKVELNVTVYALFTLSSNIIHLEYNVQLRWNVNIMHISMRAGRKVSSFLKNLHYFKTIAQNEGTIIVVQRCVEMKSSKITCAVLRTITWHILVYPIDMNINFHSKGTCKEVMRLLRIGKFVECII